VYAAGVTVAFLLVLDGTITYLQKTGTLESGSVDDAVWLMAADPWVQEGERFVTSHAARDTMPRQAFAVEKGDRWRAFLLGGSFMRGVPYSGPGSIAFWLERALRHRFPQASVELINGAATAQNSGRVKRIAEFAAAHHADALLVATCNNEGALPPHEVTERLHKLGTFRLFKQVLRGEREGGRPLHTPQDPDVDALRDAFKANLQAIVRAGKDAGATVFLCTLPVNLRYAEGEPGMPLPGRADARETAADPGPCVERGVQAAADGDHTNAIEMLRGCGEVEALRQVGLSLHALGRYDEARDALERYVELMPRNRCRPSFNQVIRDVAAAEGAVLVDLDRVVRAASPNQIPGSELFTDFCHMNWQGQAMVADELLAALLKHGPRPPGALSEPLAEDRAAVLKEAEAPP